MGYKIIYAGGLSQQKKNSTKLRLRILIAMFLLFFVLTVRLSWPEGTRLLQSVLVPGALSITETAYSQLLCDIRNGDPIGDAIQIFCRTVLNEAR